ncbi:MAG: glycoside hydrolase 3 protein [Chaenotheca gracillima]|nr:MAG: glycoside hydrolase 3 protein [Chaenotheca gracillima]
MRVASIVPVALALAPAAVSATGTLGFAIGTRVGTESDSRCKTTADYKKDFATLSSHTKLVRGYDAADCSFAGEILPAAKSAGFQVILGVWPDDDTQYKNGVNAIRVNGTGFEDQIYGVTIGSETMYRGTFTGSELMKNYIAPFKKEFPQYKVGTADSWNKYADGTADDVVRGADMVLVNAFSYWQGQDITNATGSFFDDIMQATARIQSTKGSVNGIDIKVGETGWTTEGTTYESAQPSVKNAQKFWKSGVCGMLDWGVDVFAFEAFDESWKPDSVSDNGTPADEKHWGVFDANRAPKYDISC